MFSNLFGDGRIGAILAVVIGICLLGLIGIYVWRAFGRGIRPAANRGSRQPRLGIVDAFDLDRHRQLVLVRRDNVEHLILIGGPNDLLIEDSIVRAQPSGSERREPTSTPTPALNERTGDQRQQPPRVPFEPMVAAPPAGQGQAPAVDMKSAHEATTNVSVTPPSLRPSLDQAFGEAIAPPPPLARPAAVSGSRTMPQPMPPQARPTPPPLRPAPGVPRPGAPTLAQRPVTAPAVTPPAPPTAPNESERGQERGQEPGKEPANEAPKEVPKLTLNIDSLEEEMAKLLGRPVEPPRS